MSVDELSNEASQLTLQEYVAGLIDALGATDSPGLARMRQVVGERRAQISLDAEAVYISFGPDGLNIQSSTGETNINSIGRTDSSTVLALLDGYVEVVDVIFNDQLQVVGSAEDINRIFIAVEILLDASPRAPTLQALASRFLRERQQQRSLSTPPNQRISWYPFSPESGEYQLLSRLGLLP